MNHAGPWAVLLLLAVCESALAAEPPPAPRSPRETAFHQLDIDEDGRLDVDEYVSDSAGAIADNRRTEFDLFDLNEDGSVNLDEFARQGRTAPDRESRVKIAERFDKDKDGMVSLDEFLDEHSEETRVTARFSFFKSDVDEDGFLSLSEFLERGEGSPVSPHNKFRARDLNDDGILTRDEFMRPASGKPYEEEMQSNFSRFDLDGDEAISENEFRLMPAQKPDADAWFRGLDTNDDARLSPDELVLLSSGRKADESRATFAMYDVDGDGYLNREEFFARDSSLLWEKRWGPTIRALRAAGPWLLYAAVLSLAFYFRKPVFRRILTGLAARQRRPRATDNSSGLCRSPSETPAEQNPNSTPSIDDFEIR